MKRFSWMLSFALVLALVVGVTPAQALTGGKPPADSRPATQTESQTPSQTETQTTTQNTTQNTTQTTTNTITITEVTRDKYGDVHVSWSGGTAPYNLLYYAVDGEDSTVWNVETGLTVQYGVIGELMPNFDYVIVVADAERNYNTYTLASNGKTFSALSGMRLTMTPRQVVKKSASTIKQYSASKIMAAMQGSGDQYGATVKLAGYRSRQALPFTFRMAVAMPDGEPLIFFVAKQNLPAGSSDSFAYWNFFDFTDLWSNIYIAREEIPQGTYTYYIALDDGLVASSSFTIGP